MGFESQEHRVFQAAYCRFSVFIVFADTGFSQSSNILHAWLLSEPSQVLKVSIDNTTPSDMHGFHYFHFIINLSVRMNDCTDGVTVVLFDEFVIMC